MNTQRFKPKTTRRLATCIGAAALTVLATAPAYAVHDTNIFELDRDALDSNAFGTLPDDWNTVNDAVENFGSGSTGPGGHAFAWTGAIADPVPESSIFTSGGSKDNNDISQWKWKNASNILDKDNITHAYAAAYSVDHDGNPATPNHLVIYYGLDRFSDDGSAQVGFWFFKNAIGLNGNGNTGGGDTFSGVHANGDILVQSNFTNGGSISTVTVFEWINGNLVQIATGGDCLPDTTTVGPGDMVCATVNQASTTAPWPYTPKANNGPPGAFPTGNFFEGGIDMTALGLTDACFSTFMAETRSSTPFDSVLKDFVGPHAFDTCKIEVTKVCANPQLNTAQDHITYDISGKVTASGFGSNVFDVALSDSPAADGAFNQVACLDPTSVLGSFPLATLNGEACYKNTMTVPLSQNGVKDTVTATAFTQDNGAGVKLTDTADFACPKLVISPAISVTKDCKSVVAVQNSTVVAKVNVSGQVCNTGDSNLSSVTVDDLAITTNPDPLVNNQSLAPGKCINYTGSYLPSSALDNNGNPTTCPSDVVFKDTVKATATDIFGEPVTPETDPADCKLCPVSGCQ